VKDWHNIFIAVGNNLRSIQKFIMKLLKSL